MFFDTHAHYNDNRYKEDREETMRQAFDSGVTNMVNVSYSIPSIDASIKLAEKYSYIYASVGIHPHGD